MVCTCRSSTPRGRKWGFFFLYGQRFPRYGPIFKIAIFRHETWPLVKVPGVAHILSFYPPGNQNWAYFHSTGSGFRDTGRFSRLPYFGMKLGKWPKFQKLHIYSLSTVEGQNWAYFCSTGSGFRDTANYLNCHIWAWSCVYTLFLPQGVESEFILSRQRFPRYVPSFKIAIFAWAWNLAIKVTKVPEFAHILSFYLRWSKLSLALLRAVVSEIRANFLNCHIWGWSCIYMSTLFLLQGVETEFIFALLAAVSEIRTKFQNCNIWAWNLTSDQSSRICTNTDFLPQGVKTELIFALRAAVSEIRANFLNCHIWAWNFASGQVIEVAHILFSTPGGRNWA